MGVPVNGLYDFRFRLANDALGNAYTGSAVLTNGVVVSNGLFTTTIDFGPGIFTGASYWLEVDVRTNGGGSYTVLNPFQPLASTPYAVSASAVSGSVPASQLMGSIPSVNLSGTYGAAVALTNQNNSFTGNGGGLTNVNAALLGGLASSSYWQLNGNDVGVGQFIGSTNAHPVVVKINNKQAVRYEDSTDTPNIVGGFVGNSISTNVPGGTIGGGGTVLSSQPNLITNGGDYGTIAGGYRNTISGYGGSIGGGSVNSVSNGFGAIAGGQFNIVAGSYSDVAGGYSNYVGQTIAAISGGAYNTNFGYSSTISGGSLNQIQTGANYSSIVGGFANKIQTNATYGFVFGGNNNVIGTNAQYGTILGGFNSAVTASYGIAQGVGATVNHQGSVVISDGQFAYATSSTTNEVTIRAQNGLRLLSDVGIHLSPSDTPMIVRDWDVFSTNAPSYKSGIGRWGMFMEPFNLVIGIPSNDISPRWFRVTKYSTNGDYETLMSVDQSGNVAATTFTGNAAGLYNISPSSLNNGSISAALDLTNSANTFKGTFSGDGANLSNVDAAKLGGLSASDYAQLNSSPSFSGTVSATAVTLTDSARVTGLLRVGSETGTSEAPNQSGLVVRRINSLSFTTNSVVAIARNNGNTANVSLMRDGTAGGFVVRYPASPGNVTIACMGIDSSGASKNFYTSLANPGTAGAVQIYTNSQNIVSFQCTFGNTYNAGHVTQVMLSRYVTDSFWVGTVTSTYNQ